MLPSDLFPYEKYKDKFRLPKKIKGFAEAVWEVEEDPDLCITLGKTPRKRCKRSASTAENSSHGNKDPPNRKELLEETLPSNSQVGVV